MRRRPPFPLSRLVCIACSSLQIVLAVIDLLTRLQYPQFSMMFWLYPAALGSTGAVGLIVQHPASNPALRRVFIVLNVLLMIMTACGVFAMFSFAQFSNIKQPFILVLYSLLSVVPAWFNLAATSMLANRNQDGPLY